MNGYDAPRGLPKKFWYLWSSQAVSLNGNALQLIALPLWIYAHTGSALSTGFSFAVQFVPLVVLAPWAGYIVDRFDRKRLMISCELLSAVVVAGLIAAMYSESLLGVYLLLPVLRVFNALTMPAFHAATVTLVAKEDRAKSATVMEAMIGANNAVAPLAGAGLAAWLGYESVLIVNLISFLLAAILLLPLGPLPGQGEMGGLWRSTVAAVRVISRDGVLRAAALAETSFFLFFGSGIVLALLLAKDSYGTGLAGVATSGSGVGWVLASMFIIRRFRHRPMMVMAVSALACVPAVALVVAVVDLGPAAMFTAAIALGAVNVGVGAGASVLYQQQVTSEIAGRVIALRRALLNLALAVSHVLMPAVATVGVGNGPALILFSVLTAGSVLIALLSPRARRRGTDGRTEEAISQLDETVSSVGKAP
ncbi:MFS transporter [Micromonospora sp. CA-248089]|uniref:MFS transporter n=1 Tax=Micromonospora sp. CA-248089 TaxID=3239960 RepID=UPI003D8BB172